MALSWMPTLKVCGFLNDRKEWPIFTSVFISEFTFYPVITHENKAIIHYHYCHPHSTLTINRKLWLITIIQLPSSIWSQNWFPRFAQYHIHHNNQPISQVSQLFWNAILPPIYIQLPRKQEFGWLWSCHQLLVRKSSSKISCSRYYRIFNISLDKKTSPVQFMIDQVLLCWDCSYIAF